MSVVENLRKLSEKRLSVLSGRKKKKIFHGLPLSQTPEYVGRKDSKRILPEDSEDDDGDDNFVVGDNEELVTFVHDFDNQTENNAEKEISHVEKLDLLIECEAEEKEKKEKFMKVARLFEQRATLTKMESWATDLESKLRNLFFGIDGYAECITKFDELFLNKTMVCFKADKRNDTATAALSQHAWRCVTLQKHVPRVCFLCNVYRLHCGHRLRVTSSGVSIGFLGSECAQRWSMLENVFSLRAQLLSNYGCCSEEKLREYSEKISALNETCIRTLQHLHNVFRQDDDKILD